jgi:hypothetical protein
VTFRAFQLVAGGEITEAEVTPRILAACHSNGLMTDPEDGPRAVMRTIRSGRAAGLRSPRTRRDRHAL